jgi:hypothetical protein
MLPVIQKEFGVSRSQVQWVAASNTIVWVSLVTFNVHYLKLLVGIVADRGWKVLRYLRKKACLSLWNAVVRLAYYHIRIYASEFPWRLFNIADT